MKKNTVIALSIFLILLAAVLIPKFLPDKAEKLDFELARASGVADVIEINKSGTIIRLVRDGKPELAGDAAASWKMESPIQFKANDSNVENLLKLFTEPIGMDLKIPVSEDELARYGLNDGERVSLKMTAEDKPLFDILVGKAVGNRTFVMRPGDQHVYRARTNLRWQIDKEVNDWREKKILAVERESVTGLEISNPTEKIVLVRTAVEADTETDTGSTTGEGKAESWQLTEPVTADGDSSAIGTMLGTLLNLRATDFADNIKFEDAGFTPDSTRLTINRIGKDPVIMIIGAKVGPNALDGQYENDWYVTLEGGNALYIVKDYALEGLKKRSSQLRSKNMLSFTRDKLTSIAVTNKAGKIGLTFQRDEKGWSATEPAILKGKVLNMAHLNGLINTLSNLKAAEVLEGVSESQSGLGSKPAGGKVILTMDDGSTYTLSIGSMYQPETAEYYAGVDGYNVSFILGEHVVRQLQRDPAAYLKQETANAPMP